jgi:hypothetical protein
MPLVYTDESIAAISLFVGPEGEIIVRDEHTIREYDSDFNLSWTCPTGSMPLGPVCKDSNGRLIVGYEEEGEVHIFELKEAGFVPKKENRMALDFLL